MKNISSSLQKYLVIKNITHIVHNWLLQVREASLYVLGLLFELFILFFFSWLKMYEKKYLIQRSKNVVEEQRFTA